MPNAYKYFLRSKLYVFFNLSKLCNAYKYFLRSKLCVFFNLSKFYILF